MYPRGMRPFRAVLAVIVRLWVRLWVRVWVPAWVPARVPARIPIWTIIWLGLWSAVWTAGPARAETTKDKPTRELGSYEKQAIASALARTGLEIEPEPDGKVLRRIHVVNLDVFSPRDGFLQMFNYFHRTTREEMIEREVLLDPGQAWNPDVVAETERKLRDPVFSVLAVIVPVRAARGDTATQVDMLVVTRDVWSLRLNSDFESQQSKLTYLLIAPSENNFLGLRKLAAGKFEMGQGDYSVGLLYVDKNLSGRRLRMDLRGDGIFRRVPGEYVGEPNGYEGERLQGLLSRPFWSLSSRWAGGISFFHERRVVRLFRGTELDTCTFPGDMTDPETGRCSADHPPYAYRRRLGSVQYSVSHQLGDSLKQRFEIGHRVTVQRPSLVDGFPEDQPVEGMASDTTVGELFKEAVFPRSERASEIFFDYDVFENNFVQLRNFNTYDLPEDARFGPSLSIELSASLEPIGADNTFASAGFSAGWAFLWSPGGFINLTAGASTRRDEGEFVDNVVSARFNAATPMLYKLFRVIGRFSTTTLIKDRGNLGSGVRLGGANGLRGFAIGQFPSRAPSDSEDDLFRVIGNLEVRTAPFKLGFTRGGALVFFDIGDVSYSVDDLSLHADAGFGLRFLIPQLSSLVYRFDWAFPFEGATFPGRIILGAGQAF